MDVTAYDDDSVLGRYLELYASHYMTEFEKRCVRLGILREKANATENAWFKEKLEAIWRLEGDERVEKSLKDGLLEYQLRIRRRLLSNESTRAPPA